MATRSMNPDQVFGHLGVNTHTHTPKPKPCRRFYSLPHHKIGCVIHYALYICNTCIVCICAYIHKKRSLSPCQMNTALPVQANCYVGRPWGSLTLCYVISRLLLKGAQYVTVVVRHSPTVTLRSICHTSPQYVIFFPATLLRHCSPRNSQHRPRFQSSLSSSPCPPGHQTLRTFLCVAMCWFVYTVQVIHDAQMKDPCATATDGVCRCVGGPQTCSTSSTSGIERK